MPFLWNVVGQEGQLYGNRDFQNKVNCKNPYWFSYPGYNELLTGFVDPSIHSNKKVENSNSTVFEFIQQHPGFAQKIAIFSTWDVLPYIAREFTAGIPVNAGNEVTSGQQSERQQLLNELQQEIFEDNQRSDLFTFYQAFEFAKQNQPRVVYMSFDDTDSYAHGGRYDEYLKAANKVDGLLNKLWTWIQSNPFYRDQTTLIITTDHGRGTNTKGWKNHGRLTAGSSQMWFAVVGPDTPPLGEMKTDEQYYQNQMAATMANFLGLNYSNKENVGGIVHSMIDTDKMAKRLSTDSAYPKK